MPLWKAAERFDLGKMIGGLLPDYAQVLKYLAIEKFPEAEKIILVEDNLNTHADSSLYKAFESDEARKLA